MRSREKSGFETSKEENSRFINVKKIVFMDGFLTISFLRSPWLILAFVSIVTIEYLVLNHYWQKPRTSILTSLLGNIYSSALAVPLLFLPSLFQSPLIIPATMSNEITRGVLYENISIAEFINMNLEL